LSIGDAMFPDRMRRWLFSWRSSATLGGCRSASGDRIVGTATGNEEHVDECGDKYD
jgi:hypothetical protein